MWVLLTELSSERINVKKTVSEKPEDAFPNPAQLFGTRLIISSSEKQVLRLGSRTLKRTGHEDCGELELQEVEPSGVLPFQELQELH